MDTRVHTQVCVYVCVCARVSVRACCSHHYSVHTGNLQIAGSQQQECRHLTHARTPKQYPPTSCAMLNNSTGSVCMHVLLSVARCSKLVRWSGGCRPMQLLHVHAAHFPQWIAQRLACSAASRRHCSFSYHSILHAWCLTSMVGFCVAALLCSQQALM